VSSLPEGVRQRLDALLEGRSRRELAVRSAAITATYRDRRNSADVVRHADDALAYAVARMPATHAAMAHALRMLAAAAPDLSPRSLLDAGCGTGAAAIAAHAVWPDIARFALIDRNGPFLALARELTSGLPAQVSVSPAELSDAAALPAADVVTAGYVLAEVGEARVPALARRLWAAAGQALVMTEPGTPDGFGRLRHLRDMLLAEGAHVAAPCPHDGPCPMRSPDWCRAPVRVQRSRDHAALKGATRGHEDEPVAYLALTRAPARARPAYRVIGPADVSKVEVALPACGAGGLATLRAASRSKEKYKEYKRLDWGDPA
jgi:ribosomal protein RSM22 (predicted rRNA methylase)